MADKTPLLRQWIILRILSNRRLGASVRELAEELNVSQKTIRRDLETFQTVGFPLSEAVKDRGKKLWQLDPVRAKPEMSFAFDEALSLYLGRRFLEPLAGTVFWDAAQRAFQKIRASLPPSALKYLEKFNSIFHQTLVGTSDYSTKAELIDSLVQAIEDRRIVFITYQSLRATEPVSYDIYPYGLIYHRGSLYLIGYVPDHKTNSKAGNGDAKIRHWKINRIENVDLTDLRFNQPEDFNLQNHVSKSFGVFQGDGDVHVKVRFSPSVARYVSESKWHASQRLTKDKNGGIIAEFDLDGTEEIKRWILSFGQHAEVLEPVSLVNAILDETIALNQIYSKSFKRYSKRASQTIQERRI
jgi:predicted DNA-binding transcriptional regulator YafY